MKNLSTLVIALTLCITITAAQGVAINIDGSVANSSAMLDVKSNNRGLLIPRIALTGTNDVTSISSPAASLLIYNISNTTGSNFVSPGYYYWTGSLWARLVTSSNTNSSSWLTTGNSATTDSINFIGTTDAVPLNIRVNNMRSGRIDSALQNSFWGYRAGSANNFGFENTAIGNNALRENLTGIRNTASGGAALKSNTTGNFNTANGALALTSNTIGNYNTAGGIEALMFNSTGNKNTAYGIASLRSDTSGSFNTAIGVDALYSNLSGKFNVAVGIAALYKGATPENTVAIGDSSLYNFSGLDNTAVGSHALYSNLSGYGNTAVGMRALALNIERENTAVGAEALRFNGMGHHNTATGFRALFSNSSGINNTAFGHGALLSNTFGEDNTGIGVDAITNVNTGSGNVSLGYQAMSLLTSGSNNVSIGKHSLYNNTSGSFNTAVGYYTDMNANSFTNTTAIGNGAIVYNSNTAQIGNSAVTGVFFGNPGSTVLYAGSYQTLSDERFKYNITENVPGLDFILRLKPVTYYFDEVKFNQFRKTGSMISLANSKSNHSEGILHTGFLAQDIEKTADEIGYNFDGVHKPTSDKDNYSIAYTQFVMPLIKAIQEQQDMIKAQQLQINKLAQQLQELIKASGK